VQPGDRIQNRSEPTAEPARGTVLAGRYALVSHLARGGMADVWVGHDRLLDRRVAIKILKPEIGEIFIGERRVRVTKEGFKPFEKKREMRWETTLLCGQRSSSVLVVSSRYRFSGAGWIHGKLPPPLLESVNCAWRIT
jgi:hypothetical protein